MTDQLDECAENDQRCSRCDVHYPTRKAWRVTFDDGMGNRTEESELLCEGCYEMDLEVE